MIANPLMRTALTATADLLEKLLKQQKAGPREGSGYTLPRMIEVALWDRCTSGGETVDAFEFEDGEVEALVALIREAIAPRPEAAPGWKLVPETLTEDMRNSLMASVHLHDVAGTRAGRHVQITNLWSDVLNIAPPAPVSAIAAHDWKPDGGVLRFESHPHGEAPHVHATCSKCGARAWFLEYQWELLTKGCVGINPAGWDAKISEEIRPELDRIASERRQAAHADIVVRSSDVAK